MAPELSPAETMVSPATLEAVMAGVAKPMRAGLLATAGVTRKARRLQPPGHCRPAPNIWLKLMPVVPRWVVSLVTLSE